MDSEARKLTEAALRAKLDGLLKERESLRSQFEQMSRRDRMIDREIADCRVAARVFELDITFPPEEPDTSYRAGLDLRSRYRSLIAPSPPSPPPAPPPKVVMPSVTQGSIDKKTAPPTADVPANVPMPRIRDVALDRLRFAGEHGAKASEIILYIATTYNVALHEKSVGMTLYRLSQETSPLVHRKGHTWFYGPPPAGPENPGGETPGQTSTGEEEGGTDA